MSNLLNGAVLLIGSLYWEDEHNAVLKEQGKLRSDWRLTSLDMEDAVIVTCPIRYGRKSASRFNTYTMVFSNSCPVSGKAILVPFKNPVDSERDLMDLAVQAQKLANAEGITKPSEFRTYNKWGVVGLAISPKLFEEKPDAAQKLKEFWANRNRDFSNKGYCIEGTESPTVDNDALMSIDFDWDQHKNMPDYFLCTSTKPELADYPEADTVARAMKTAKPPYFTYFNENMKSGIYTYLDADICKYLPTDIASSFANNPDRIKMEDYNGHLTYFRRDLVLALGENVYANSYKELAISLLQCIEDDFELIDAPDDNELQKVFKMLIAKYDSHFSDYGMYSRTAGNIFSEFVQAFLGYEKLPYIEKERLEKAVKADLKRRTDQILAYEEIDFIRKLKSGEESPRDHQEMMIAAFYKRNLDEADKILHHYLYKLDDRVLHNCSIGNTGSISERAMQAYFDRPYFSSLPNSDAFFDHDKINKARHRLYDLPTSIEDGNRLVELYKVDKTSFYDQLKSISPPAHVFQSIISSIDFSSGILQHRKDLFLEMKALFLEQKWYGFYALALSQIEGIFTEMVKLVNPHKHNYPSLSYKVNDIRSVYDYASQYMDYFEYHIPFLRNKFMHSGIDTISEIECHDLLYDVRYLAITFHELKTPVILTNKLINAASIINFSDVAGFNHYFKLLDTLKEKKQYDSLKEKIDDFEITFLSQHTSLEYLASEVGEQLEDKFDFWYQYQYEYFFNMDSSLNLFEASKTEIGKKENLLLIEHFLKNANEHFETLISYDYFLKKIKTYIPSMSEEAANNFESVRKKYQDDFEKISIIEKHLKPVITEYRSQLY